jgi:hypothetical protein
MYTKMNYFLYFMYTKINLKIILFTIFFFFLNGIILLMRSTGVLQRTLELVLPGAAGLL